jgi:hypothetical protein
MHSVWIRRNCYCNMTVTIRRANRLLCSVRTAKIEKPFRGFTPDAHNIIIILYSFLINKKDTHRTATARTYSQYHRKFRRRSRRLRQTRGYYFLHFFFLLFENIRVTFRWCYAGRTMRVRPSKNANKINRVNV